MTGGVGMRAHAPGSHCNTCGCANAYQCELTPLPQHWALLGTVNHNTLFFVFSIECKCIFGSIIQNTIRYQAGHVILLDLDLELFFQLRGT